MADRLKVPPQYDDRGIVKSIVVEGVVGFGFQPLEADEGKVLKVVQGKVEYSESSDLTGDKVIDDNWTFKGETKVEGAFSAEEGALIEFKSGSEVSSSTNFEFTQGKGVILLSPNGNKWLLTVDNSGQLSAVVP